MLDQKSAELVRKEFENLLPEKPPSDYCDRPLADLGVDSLEFYEALMTLDDVHGISFDTELLDEKISINYIVANARK